MRLDLEQKNVSPVMVMALSYEVCQQFKQKRAIEFKDWQMAVDDKPNV